MLHFTVSDTGIGIPRDKHALIFEPFLQADSSTTRRFGGTGLGLSISRQLVELMGGKIWLESSEFHGASFHFCVPLRVAPHASMFAPLVKVEEDRLLRALVADDNTTYRKALERRLRSFGMAVTAVGNGKAALEELAQAQRAHTPYALLVIDSEMPGMDGFAFAAHAQQRFGLGRAIIMMVTSDKCGYTATRCLELGIVAHLLKPVGRIELLSAAQQVVGEALPVPWQKPVPEPAVIHDKARSRSWRVLLAEDNLINRKVAVAMLQRAGHGVIAAETGKEAVQLATSMDFDFILMDIQMPEMDGMEATGMIRDREAGSGRHVPIIAMTAHAFKGDHERFLAAGMDGYIAKPFQPSELLETLQKIHSQLVTTRSQVVGTAAQSTD